MCFFLSTAENFVWGGMSPCPPLDPPVSVSTLTEFVSPSSLCHNWRLANFAHQIKAIAVFANVYKFSQSSIIHSTYSHPTIRDWWGLFSSALRRDCFPFDSLRVSEESSQALYLQWRRRGTQRYIRSLECMCEMARKSGALLEQGNSI